jgi:hypothetical protein
VPNRPILKASQVIRSSPGTREQHRAIYNTPPGRPDIRVRFTHKTELCWTIRTASAIQEADLSDWKTGDEERLEYLPSAKVIGSDLPVLPKLAAVRPGRSKCRCQMQSNR